jgi:hypothetical protein
MAVRGYAKWNPKGEAAYWVNRVLEVLKAYEAEWPLSNRQLFYRLVAEHSYDKTEKAYNNLTQMVSRARRAGYIDWTAIRDGGLGTSASAQFYNNEDEFHESVRASARYLRLDRQKGQPQAIELWCEAGGMFPILQQVARPYGVRANTGGGYDSVTAKHRLALRVAERASEGLPTLVLHVGDFDGSGENMCDVLREDAGAMAITQVLKHAVWTAKQLDGHEEGFQDAPGHVWDDIEGVRDGDGDLSTATIRWAYDFFKVERVALTGQQVVDREVITAPPKKSDSRTRGFVEANWDVVEQLGTEDISAQLEALTPQELRDLISEVIEGHMDLDAYEAVKDEERIVRAKLLKALDS